MERMKEFILSPEEIYYIGKVSGGKYLDYDYIAAMQDIGKRGKIRNITLIPKFIPILGITIQKT